MSKLIRVTASKPVAVRSLFEKASLFFEKYE